jgi:CheY-like chemotaxis protein
LDHGTEQGKDALNSLIYLVGEVFGANVTFKMDNADLGLYLKGYEKFDLIEKLDTLRINVSKSDMFLSPLTISIGVVFPSELKLDAPAYDFVVDKYLDLGFDRMRQAKHLGANIVCFEGTQDIKHAARHQILLVDSDVTNLEIIEAFLNEVNITVFKATDGIKASEIAIRELPDLIISEVNLPRLDGFLLCEYLKSNSKTKNIPVVFLSYQKDEPSVSRAQTLGVSHYFKKPYLLYELLGIIKYYTKS